jgi:hypothetical protein
VDKLAAPPTLLFPDTVMGYISQAVGNHTFVSGRDTCRNGSPG